MIFKMYICLINSIYNTILCIVHIGKQIKYNILCKNTFKVILNGFGVEHSLSKPNLIKIADTLQSFFINLGYKIIGIYLYFITNE